LPTNWAIISTKLIDFLLDYGVNLHVHPQKQTFGLLVTPSSVKEKVLQNNYTNERHQGLIYGFDNANSIIDRQITKNRCHAVLSQIKVPWTKKSS